MPPAEDKSCPRDLIRSRRALGVQQGLRLRRGSHPPKANGLRSARSDRNIAQLEIISYSGSWMGDTKRQEQVDLLKLRNMARRDRELAKLFAEAILDPPAPNAALLKAAMDYLESIKGEDEQSPPIRLSKRDTARFVEALENPPAPSVTLREAAKKYREAVDLGELIIEDEKDLRENE